MSHLIARTSVMEQNTGCLCMYAINLSEDTFNSYRYHAHWFGGLKHRGCAGITTNYGLDGMRIESLWRRDILHPSTPPSGPTQPPEQSSTGSLSWRYSGRRVTLTTHPHLAPKLKKNRATPLLPIWAFVGCYRVCFDCFKMKHACSILSQIF